MIKFFRHIRHNLLSEKLFGKYMIYAIGEIILVVIGILLALQINNWNNERILQNTKNSLLMGLIDDLKVDTSAFKAQIKFYQDLIDSKKYELEKSSYEACSIETLEELISAKYYPNRLNDLTFQKIRTLGIIDISKDEELSERINYYYQRTNEWYDGIMDWEINYTYKEYDYWVYEQNVYEGLTYVDIPKIQNEEESRLHLIQLITAPKGRNYLKENLYRKSRVLDHVKSIKKRATELLIDIQNELNITKG